MNVWIVELDFERKDRRRQMSEAIMRSHGSTRGKEEEVGLRGEMRWPQRHLRCADCGEVRHISLCTKCRGAWICARCEAELGTQCMYCR